MPIKAKSGGCKIMASICINKEEENYLRNTNSLLIKKHLNADQIQGMNRGEKWEAKTRNGYSIPLILTSKSTKRNGEVTLTFSLNQNKRGI